jgi:hypothetical protein
MEAYWTVIGIMVAVYFLGCAIGGYYVAAEKGREPGEGIAFGVLLGPLGMIIVACLPMVTGPAPAAPSRLRAEADEVDDPVQLERFLKRGAR